MPPASSCSWEFAPRSLLAGFIYSFSLTVSKLSGSESVDSSVVITIQPGALPAVEIAPLAQLKQNPSSKLALQSIVTIPDYDADMSAESIVTTKITEIQFYQ